MTEHYEVTFKDVRIFGKRGYRRLSTTYDIISSVMSAVIVVAIMLLFFFRVATVDGRSMVPTLDDEDRLIITNISKNYKYGDIVVIHREDEESLIKRVIAVGGDTIDIDFEKGIVYVNGEALDEDYIAEPTYVSFMDGPNFPFEVPKGYLFCMGDNRNDSLDSRSGSIGLINEQYIVGKMVIDFDKPEAS